MPRPAAVLLALTAVVSACGNESDDVGSAPPESSTTSESTTTTTAGVVVDDRATQQNLRSALSAEKTLYAEFEAYSDDLALLREVEPELQPVQGLAPTVVGSVYVAVSSDKQLVCLSAVSSTGTVFVVADLVPDGIFYGRAAIASCDKATVRRLAESWG